MGGIERHFHPGQLLCGRPGLFGRLGEDPIHLGHGLPFVDDRGKLPVRLLVLQVDVLVLLLHRHVLLEGHGLAGVRRSGQGLRVKTLHASLLLGLVLLLVLDELHYPVVLLQVLVEFYAAFGLLGRGCEEGNRRVVEFFFLGFEGLGERVFSVDAIFDLLVVLLVSLGGALAGEVDAECSPDGLDATPYFLLH